MKKACVLLWMVLKGKFGVSQRAVDGSFVPLLRVYVGSNDHEHLVHVRGNEHKTLRKYKQLSAFIISVHVHVSEPYFILVLFFE